MRWPIAGATVQIALCAGLLATGAPQPAAGVFLDPQRDILVGTPASEGQDDEPRLRTEYDPLWGMDENGRIPATHRKQGLAYPDRWRYVPEARIKPGNILQRFFVTSFIVPYAFSNSDVGTGFGLALTDMDFRHQRRQEFVAAVLSYTSEGQQDYHVKWRRWLNHIDLPEGGILQEERSQLELEVGYLNTLTLRFFGLGPNTDASDETSYSDESIYADLFVDKTLPNPGSNWVMHLGGRFESHALGQGKVKGKPSTGDIYPGLFSEAQDENITWLRVGMRYDTRDSQQTPYSGWHVGALVAWAPIQSNGSMGAKYTLKSGKVFRVPGLFHRGGDKREENPPTDTIALHFRNEYTSGDLPFFALPTLGGPEQHRGFIAGRFRDRSAWLAAAEYRFWVLPRGLRITKSVRIERIGAAFFYEVGAVSGSLTGLYAQKVRHTYGTSLRISIDRSNPLRFDFGFSEDGMEFSLGYGLTF